MRQHHEFMVVSLSEKDRQDHKNVVVSGTAIYILYI